MSKKRTPSDCFFGDFITYWVYLVREKRTIV